MAMQNCRFAYLTQDSRNTQTFCRKTRTFVCYVKSQQHTTGAASAGIRLHFISAMSKSFAAELQTIANSLVSGDAGNQQLSIAKIADRIAKDLHVKPDEVAILAVSERWRHLYFLVPDALRNVGHIPLTSTSALAARTVRESRPEIVNNFNSVRHASVFEGVKAETLTATAIQKIVSAPILSDGKVIGVIQISRKAQTRAEAGPDFTGDDLGKLLAICKPLGMLIQHIAKE